MFVELSIILDIYFGYFSDFYLIFKNGAISAFREKNPFFAFLSRFFQVLYLLSQDQNYFCLVACTLELSFMLSDHILVHFPNFQDSAKFLKISPFYGGPEKPALPPMEAYFPKTFSCLTCFSVAIHAFLQAKQLSKAIFMHILNFYATSAVHFPRTLNFRATARFLINFHQYFDFSHSIFTLFS